MEQYEIQISERAVGYVNTDVCMSVSFESERRIELDVSKNEFRVQFFFLPPPQHWVGYTRTQ